MATKNKSNMFENKIQVSGRLSAVARVVDAIGNVSSERTLVPEQDNLILNRGLDTLLTTTVALAMAYCHVGTNDTPPEVTDTTLGNKLVSTNSHTAGDNTVTVSYDDDFVTRTCQRTYLFGTGVAAGTLTEIGISDNATNVNTRALFKDPFGNPTAVTVAANEQLVVTYVLIFKIPLADQTLVATMKGVEYTLTLRPYQYNVNVAIMANNYSLAPFWPSNYGGYGGDNNFYCHYGATSGLQTGLGNPTGTQSPILSGKNMIVDSTYVSGTFYRVRTLTLPIGYMTYADIGVLFKNFGSSVLPIVPYTIGISPRITKEYLDQISIGVKVAVARL